MRVPILNGIYSDITGDFRVSYPTNLVPVAQATGLDNGYLKPAEGLQKVADGTGFDRGGINYKDKMYRVMGSKLILVNSSFVVTEIGDVGLSAYPVSMTYGFDRLAIVSNSKLFYLFQNNLIEVTDTDLGLVYDSVWIAGYFAYTDGTYIVVTELNDPTQINPLKYGSSESDPDKIRGLLKLRNELVALNRYTIEFFENIGGDNFPFQRIAGAQIQKGSVGTHTKCLFMDSFAFMGGGFNESISIYIATNGSAIKIATREIDTILSQYVESELALVLLEARVDQGQQLLYIHLTDKTLVYDAAATLSFKEPVWYILKTNENGYDARSFVRCYGKWLFGNPRGNEVGYLTDATMEHYDETVDWEFSTPIAYNDGKGAIIHDMELVTLPGRYNFVDDPVIWTSYSLDGENWSQERSVSVGKYGEKTKRIVWFQQGAFNNWRIQKFRGNSDAKLSIGRLEMTVEKLYA